MMLDSEISRMIALVYDGIEQPRKWDQALRRFREIADARLLFFGRMDIALAEPEQTGIVGPEISRIDDGLDLHRREIYRIDPTLYFAMANPDGGTFKLSEATDAASPELAEWRLLQRHYFGSVDHHCRYTPRIEGLSFCLALHPHADDGLVSERQQRLHALFFEHMANAVRIAARPPDLAAGSEPCLLLDRTGRVLQANARAKILLSRRDGLSIRAGRLRAAHRATADRLERSIAAVCGALETGVAGHGLAIARSSGAPDYLLRITPMPIPLPPFQCSGAGALVRIVEREAPANAIEEGMLRGLFGLTPREAELAKLFAEGARDLPQAARKMKLSYETARTHLHKIFEKCEISSQLELVALLARTV